MQPLIGISCPYDNQKGRFFLPEAYTNAVITAGGIPVILPGPGSIKTVQPYLKAVRGLVLAGGGDLDPKYFGEEPQQGMGEVTPDRDRFEMKLVKAALRNNIPVLGICRGIQVLNVACGGTLMQNVADGVAKPLKHFQDAPRWYATHRIKVEKDSLLGRIFSSGTARVNSFHHQAVRQVAPGFKASAVSSDGVVEAIENYVYRFAIGVQWHPECMVDKDKKARLLFEAFMEAVRSG